jgi:flagellar hook-length control protein FliK
VPVATISSGRSASEAEPASNTPAGLPSGQVSFADELGRETALDRQRGKSDDSHRSTRVAKPTREPTRERTSKSGTRSSKPRRAEATKRAAKSSDPSALVAPPDAKPPAADESSEPAIDDLDPSAGAAIAALDSGDASELDGLGPALLGRAGAASTVTGADETSPFAASAVELAVATLARPDADLALTKDTADSAPRVAATAAESFGAMLDELQLHAALEGARAADAKAPTAPPPAPRESTPPPASHERAVALAELPRELGSRVDGFLKVRGHGDRWEAEIRLDPPELGTLRVRLELRGHELHGVVHVQDRRLEPLLSGLFHDLEQQLRQQGQGEASFEFSRGANQEGEGREWAASSAQPPLALVVAAPVRGSGPRGDRLVDLLA